MLVELLNTAIGPLKAKAWLGILALTGIIVGAWITIADNRDKRMVETARDAGGNAAVVQGQQTTLEQNRSANDAEQVVRRGGDAAVAGCMSDARGHASGCSRFAD